MALARGDLERWTTIDAAECIVRSCYGDRASYPDDAFFERRRGINKDIPEEYWPLLLLARALPDAQALRLTAPGTEGPDGEIRKTDGSVLTVQVTSSVERHLGYVRRRQLRDTGQHSTNATSTSEIVEAMLRRIIDALREKEHRYRQGTAVLVIREESVSWGSVLGPTLKARLVDELNRSTPSAYESIYITFNEEVWRLR